MKKLKANACAVYQPFCRIWHKSANKDFYPGTWDVMIFGTPTVM
ncbi:hypothetical protein [Chitinophaga pinensis]|nr:hypothetical protein [Chitinophaga pinensis]